ncbi:hypothetical protein HZA26_01700, partial [Candidatus Nomurabacteria bacterium]|nr:hypothetical protein [Candidatus Nomurabacteria bacterium]
MKKYFVLVFLLIISGTLSISEYDPFYGFGIIGLEMVGPFQPGIVFGILTGIWFIFFEKTSIGKAFFWAMLSVLAYYVAVNTAGEIANRADPETMLLPFFCAGLIGAFILSLSTHFL